MRSVNAARRSGFALTLADTFNTPVLSDRAARMRPLASAGDSTERAGASLMPRRSKPSSAMAVYGCQQEAGEVSHGAWLRG
ncbi:polyketide synthase [Penicillium chermesinum]|uniref:Polyketide synthase n=1 Tax=Penicillium chermesinum TaxID=63820 RepID=A0A9W9PH02_9EURO|nr:polyketide synthase [Penicillium chermesinum]KAJ5246554.1 polyketide synthase [Penicillium chermesinum]KAJ6144822.1 polyketide synthase [Penicillium chermesinum]